MKKFDIPNDKNCKAVQFESLTDLHNFIKECRGKRRWSACSGTTAGYSFDDALNQMIYGYEFNQKTVDNLKDFKNEDVVDTGGMCMDVVGSAYDMGSVIQGIPECCISDTAIEPKKYIRLVASVGFPHWVESEQIKNRGIAIANLVGTLMLKGYIVDLDFIMSYKPRYGSKTTAWLVRIPTGSFCSSTIAFLTSPQFLRKICVAVSDFILNENIDGTATGRKDTSVLNWCKDNALYFEDWYDNEELPLSKFHNIKSAQEEINNQYEKWLEKQKKIKKI